jgi:hypothetical protein
MNKALLIGAVAGLALYLANKGRAAVKLEYYFKNVDVSHLSLTNYRINASMDVVNPSNTSQVVDAVFANIFLPDGTQLGRIEQTTPQTIAERGTTTISTPIILFPSGIGKLVGMMINTGGQLPTITIKGTIVSMGISIPLDTTI